MTEDSILDALDKIKDWAMERMMKAKGGASEEAHGEPVADDAESQDMPADPEQADIEIDVEPEAPKSSVLKRYDFAGRGGSSAPAEMPKKRGRPPKVR